MTKNWFNVWLSQTWLVLFFAYACQSIILVHLFSRLIIIDNKNRGYIIYISSSFEINLMNE